MRINTSAKGQGGSQAFCIGWWWQRPPWTVAALALKVSGVRKGTCGLSSVFFQQTTPRPTCSVRSNRPVLCRSDFQNTSRTMPFLHLNFFICSPLVPEETPTHPCGLQVPGDPCSCLDLSKLNRVTLFLFVPLQPHLDSVLPFSTPGPLHDLFFLPAVLLS